ncbi:MAG: hypothetical protein A3H98_11885 [Bacteroidetes bacterium RIFCSPLOWO2_02_FULL_36_8]|nr:MAG: hypothetical protein A3H98_11885 [Bacteroidetes bacterium RIFCSPLOWO2_02_FULL_36_8]OFY69584.1 MAG: hypothetical protein A3G23_11145 [Bacteroidetes bacterium RIFCSPLOWO2_12_FULL_37_12]
MSFLAQIINPATVKAITSGPTQPEVLGFQPVGSSDMVDLFTGDFSYNIPLMDVGGYPINLSYQSGITMEQEASWVGLGWSLNPGAIVRNVRGLPDDFNGDNINKDFNIQAQHAVGVNFTPAVEFFGADPEKLFKDKANKTKSGFGIGLSYNNYTGFGFQFMASPAIASSENAKTGKTTTLGLSVSSSSESGVDIKPTLSFEKRKGNAETGVTGFTSKIGLPFNSRQGLKALTLDVQKDKIFNNPARLKGGKIKMVEERDNLFSTGGSLISFASSPFTPQISNSMFNLSLNFKFTFGGEIFGGHFNGELTAYYSGQFLNDKHTVSRGYGYLYTHNAYADDEEKVLLDFNREKDGTFTDNTPNLPLTNFTYDVYSVNGQGIGGVYRPFRSDVGIVFDPRVSNIGVGLDFPGIELGFGNAAHIGADFGVDGNHSTSGKWEGHKIKSLKFSGSSGTPGTPGDPFYEPFYFKQAGEKTAESDIDFFNNIGGFSPVRVKLDDNLLSTTVINTFEPSDTSDITIPENILRARRQPRNQSISLLTAIDAEQAGLVNVIENYEMNKFPMDMTKRQFKPLHTIKRSINSSKGTVQNNYAPDHHISEITALRPDGARYVYGIPAYNATQVEASFAVKVNGDCGGLVTYNPEQDVNVEDIDGKDINGDDLIENQNGLDHFVSKTTTPSYAHSYLLTAILSPDYIDNDEVPGPSDGDFGSYTKINYSKLLDDYSKLPVLHKWRTPYQVNNANFNEGLKSVTNDDKASYVYGEKEIWYVHSIETKTHVATFSLFNRDDGFGVDGDAGGFGNYNTLKRIDKITLYSKPDFMKNGVANATPIKTVHFEYDYSLCSGILNNGRSNNPSSEFLDTEAKTGTEAETGKLTLKSIFFTYGKSGKGKLSPYVFHYKGKNPGYQFASTDRWGNYKLNGCSTASPMSNAEFPYVEQIKTEADDNASAWCLTEIDLPSGGLITINYESDDYAYVQDLHAMQMFKIARGGELNDDTKLYFTIPNNNNELTFQRDYIRGMKTMYFRFLVDIDGTGKKEYVSGYAKIAEIAGSGIEIIDNKLYGWVKLETVHIPNGIGVDAFNTNPIKLAAWNFTKMNLPHLAYDQPTLNDNGLVQVAKGIASSITGLLKFLIGFYNSLELGDYADTFVPEKSFIRLYNPDGKKLGGGSRVKKITIRDAWFAMTGNKANYQAAEYGQDYSYTKNEKLSDGSGSVISSGVASYEPLIGRDENPWRQPVAFTVDKYLVPDEDHFQETPFGESFFPSPSVGYSRVEVKNIVPNDVKIKRHGTGRVVHEYYTARDFPTKVYKTGVNPVHYKPNPLFSLLKVGVNDFMTASQGFSIELNDMNGKEKNQMVYQEGSDEPISGVEYFYHRETVKSEGKDIPINRLNNQIQTISKNKGSIKNNMVGVDYDFVLDMREHKSTSIGVTLSGNLDAFFAAIFPLATYIVLPGMSEQMTRFRSVVATKVINRYGLIDSVAAYDLGSRVVTKNLLYDEETGEVLLTETKNQFDDPVYSFTYPAHWGYDRMGPAYKNAGLTINIPPPLPPINIDATKYFIEGDEISVDGTTYWVTRVNNNSVTAMVADYTDHTEHTFNNAIKIIRSGRRNQQTIPIGTVTTLKNPIQTGTLTFEKIINASAVEFSDDWKIFCECGKEPPQKDEIVNRFVLGLKGNFHAKRSHLYLTGRTQSEYDNNTNIRTDGTFSTDFKPFWNPTNINDWQIYSNKWTWTSEVTEYSPFGFELENRDALKRYSSAVYGYNNTLPISVASNSRYTESGFDSFEDYDFNTCIVEHFSFKESFKDFVNDKNAHSGRKSIKVAPGKKAYMLRRLIGCPPTPSQKTQ